MRHRSASWCHVRMTPRQQKVRGFPSTSLLELVFETCLESPIGIVKHKEKETLSPFIRSCNRKGIGGLSLGGCSAFLVSSIQRATSKEYGEVAGQPPLKKMKPDIRKNKKSRESLPSTTLGICSEARGQKVNGEVALYICFDVDSAE